MAFTALLDANVLWRAPVHDTILRAAERDVAVGLAELRGITVEECEAATTANFERIFGG
ncbi:MAG: hypothetical protein HYY05_07940 [Chloroflexi bacterium]|nr:hypothetical protein [Chloroflexota bacterium]